MGRWVTRSASTPASASNGRRRVGATRHVHRGQRHVDVSFGDGGHVASSLAMRAVDGEAVPGGTEAGHRGGHVGRDHGVVAPVLARLGVGDVELDLHAFEGGERVGERERVVRERAGVDDDRRAPPASVVDGVDEVAFVVGLHVLEPVAAIARGGGGEIDEIGQRGGAVDLRFALAEQVQVGTRHQEDGSRHGFSLPHPRRHPRRRTRRRARADRDRARSRVRADPAARR